MTQRVRKSVPPDTGTQYQLPPGPLWWLCRYFDGDKVSETLFQHAEAQTWFGANVVAQRDLREKFRMLPEYKVTLYE